MHESLHLPRAAAQQLLAEGQVAAEQHIHQLADAAKISAALLDGLQQLLARIIHGATGTVLACEKGGTESTGMYPCTICRKAYLLPGRTRCSKEPRSASVRPALLWLCEGLADFLSATGLQRHTFLIPAHDTAISGCARRHSHIRLETYLVDRLLEGLLFSMHSKVCAAIWCA